MFSQRLTDADGVDNISEHHSMKAFFRGKGRPVSLTESLLPISQLCGTGVDRLISLFPDLLGAAKLIASNFAENILINADRKNMSIEVRNSVDSLYIDEAASVCVYAMEYGPYVGLNKLLRVENRHLLSPFVNYLWLLMHGLSKCPKPTSAIVYRGTTSAISSHYTVGGVVIWSTFSSCTTKLAVLESAMTLGKGCERTYFQITLTTNRARSIRHLRVMPGEDEILLPPNTRLRVMDKADRGNGLWVVQLLELPCLDPILVFPDQSGRLLYRRDLHNIPPAP